MNNRLRAACAGIFLLGCMGCGSAIKTIPHSLPLVSPRVSPTRTVARASTHTPTPTRTSTPMPEFPVGIPDGVPFHNIAVATGGYHTCALTAVGGVKCWGQNSFGELGDGTTLGKRTPVDVFGLTHGVKAIHASQYSTCALTDAGGVKCWGQNLLAATGDAASTGMPADVPGLASGVTAITKGINHACALMAEGGVKCWGNNMYGQLGDGTKNASAVPVEVIGLTSRIIAITASQRETYALTAEGGVKIWGSGWTSPRDVAGLTSGVAAISSSDFHACALLTGGEVKCWGKNEYGQLGNGTTVDNYTPGTVSGLPAGIRAVSAGYRKTCAITAEGALKCWGDNRYGQLGDGTTSNRSTPVDVTGLTSDISAVSTVGWHTCALNSFGGIQCWGANIYGQLGDGTDVNRSRPVDAAGLTGGIREVSTGVYHRCFLTGIGGVKCAGRNNNGQLGNGTTADSLTPVQAAGLTGGIRAITAEGDHSCALTSSGGVKCWGNNADGQLGDGTLTTRLSPVDVAGLESGVVAVSAGMAHTCALTSTGGVKCWGRGGNGQLGDGKRIDSAEPVDVTGLTGGVKAIEAGLNFTCAVTTNGAAKCWGINGYGQLGDSTLSMRPSPVDVIGLNSGVAAIEAGFDHTCALTDGGTVKCWGRNDYGQLGDGTNIRRLSPVDVFGLPGGIRKISAGSYFNFAVTEVGGVKGWGKNDFGQLGDNSLQNRNQAVDVYGLNGGISAVFAGAGHTCAITFYGWVQCWGLNYYGQLGDGTTSDRKTPVFVIGLTP